MLYGNKRVFTFLNIRLMVGINIYMASTLEFENNCTVILDDI